MRVPCQRHTRPLLACQQPLRPHILAAHRLYSQPAACHAVPRGATRRAMRCVLRGTPPKTTRGHRACACTPKFQWPAAGAPAPYVLRYTNPLHYSVGPRCEPRLRHCSSPLCLGARLCRLTRKPRLQHCTQHPVPAPARGPMAILGTNTQTTPYRICNQTCVGGPVSAPRWGHTEASSRAGRRLPAGSQQSSGGGKPPPPGVARSAAYNRLYLCYMSYNRASDCLSAAYTHEQEPIGIIRRQDSVRVL